MTIKEFIELTKDFDPETKIYFNVDPQLYEIQWDGYANKKGESGIDKALAVILTSEGLSEVIGKPKVVNIENHVGDINM
jgi:hypothetical protein